jgi:hypothetical protein
MIDIGDIDEPIKRGNPGTLPGGGIEPGRGFDPGSFLASIDTQ